jgi:hypothetical protein
VDFYPVEDGVCYSAVRRLDDGREVDRVSHWMAPNIMSVPDVQLRPGPSTGVSWVVPVDDDAYVQVFARKVAKTVAGAPRPPLKMGGKSWAEMSDEDHQRFPGDYEAQAGQGPISLHSEEHLATSDRGIVMQRRTLERNIKAVAAGEDPIGVNFDEGKALVKVRSGNFYRVLEGAD